MKYAFMDDIKGYVRSIAVLAVAALMGGASALAAPAQTLPNTAADKISVNAEGVVHVPAQDVPVSRFLSPEGKKYMADHLKAMASPGQYQKDAAGYLERQRILYPHDPLASPIVSPEVLAKFPPTLLVTGTRGMEMSSAVYTHTQLLKAGVDARIAVWEGLFHGFFYNPDVPESKDCYDVIVRYFDRQLGK